MNKSFTVAGARYDTRLLAPPDIQRLQRLFDRCTDYFRIATGAPAVPEEATRAFVAGPPSKEVSDKRIVGILQDETLVGVLDSIKDWPSDGVWTMGMLLIDPDHRGKGLGSKVLEEFEGWSASEGAKAFRTALVSHHAEGARFLERFGYARDETMDNYAAGSQVSTIQFFEKRR